MSLYRHVRTVLSMREPATESQTSPVYVILPSDTDPTPDHALGFRLLVQAVEPAEVAVAATAPAPVPAPPTPALPRVPIGSLVPVAPLPLVPEAIEEAEEEEPELEEPVGGTVVVETSADRERWVPVHEAIDL